MRNPITEIRKKQGASLLSWARDAGIHHQALYLNECGVYVDVLPTLLEFIEGLGYDGAELEANYHLWVAERREEVRESLDFLDDLPEPCRSVHPFVCFREALGLSRMAFCKTFLVHPASIYELEHGKMLKLPGQLVDALRSVGISDTVIEELGFRCGEFYVSASVA